MTLINPEPYREYPIRELRNIVRCVESNDAPGLLAALKAAIARRGLGRAFPELAEDLRAVEARIKREAA